MVRSRDWGPGGASRHAVLRQDIVVVLQLLPGFRYRLQLLRVGLIALLRVLVLVGLVQFRFGENPTTLNHEVHNCPREAEKRRDLHKPNAECRKIKRSDVGPRVDDDVDAALSLPQTCAADSIFSSPSYQN